MRYFLTAFISFLSGLLVGSMLIVNALHDAAKDDPERFEAIVKDIKEFY